MKAKLKNRGEWKSGLLYLLIFVFLILFFQTLCSFCESLREEIKTSLEVEKTLREKNSELKVEIASLTKERLLILTAMEKLNLRRASDEDTYVIVK